MSPQQIIKEILADYRHNLAGGMPQEQSLEVLRAMLIDLIEFEKQTAYDLGLESGKYAILWDLKTKGADYVIRTYAPDSGAAVIEPQTRPAA